MRVIIDRYGCTNRGTFGEIRVCDGAEQLFEGFTVEQPWNYNKAFQSCIPSGQYELVPFSSERWGETFAIVGGTVSKYKEPGKLRYACLFHTANLPRNVQGCIGIGRRQGFIDDQWAVLHSKDAVSEFLQTLYPAGDSIPLLINGPRQF